jgi:hypothetical protein
MMFRYSLKIAVILVVLVSQTFADKLAVISKVQGDVMLKKSGTFEYDVQASLGTIIEDGDRVKVGEGFAVLFLVDDKSQLKLRPNTDMGLRLTPNDNGESFHVSLDYGQLLTEYNKTSDYGFTLQTPTSVASIKGTKFWTNSGEDGDQVVVVEGLVEVANSITGMTVDVPAGETANSTNSGGLDSGPSEDGDIPLDPEEEFGDAGDEETSDEVATDSTATDSTITGDEDIVIEETLVEEDAEDYGVTPPNVTAPTDMPPSSETETETETEEEGGGGLLGKLGENVGMNAGFGAVTIDGKLYNQIALRPDINIGKLGVGLDVILYMDEDGNIRKDDWNDAGDILDKIMYVRWGAPGDPLFARVGTLTNSTLGYGLFMTGYNNAMEYPSIKKIGTHFGGKVGPVGIEALIADFKEFTTDPELAFGLGGIRATYSLGKLAIGATLVSDQNQYLGLKDADGDGFPDLVDDFADDASYSKDTDGDGLPDESDGDLDGDNVTDVVWVFNDGNTIDISETEISGYTEYPLDTSIDAKNDPFNIHDNPRGIYGLSFDVGYPVLNKDWLNLFIFSEFGTYMGGQDSSYVKNDSDIFELIPNEYGWGLAAPGIRANLFKIVDMSLEYRMTGGNFVYGLFDQNYDIERVSFVNVDGVGLSPQTRYEKLHHTPSLGGVFGSLNVNLFNVVTIMGGYQDMRSGDGTEVKGIMAEAGIKPDLIPKVKGAKAFLNRMNVGDPWDLKSEGTLMGYQLSIDMGGALLTWNYRQSFRDLDGSGIIDQDNETITTVSIETGISF